MSGLAAGALLAVTPHAAKAQVQEIASAPGYERIKVYDSTTVVSTVDGNQVIQDGIYVIAGPDGNVVIQTGNDGGLAVDSQLPDHAATMVGEVKKVLGDRTLRFYLNTNGDPDRTGGNQKMRESGRQVFGGNVAGNNAALGQNAAHLAQENVLRRLSEPGGMAPGQTPDDWPQETYATDTYDFNFNNEGIVLYHEPRAHTDGDSIIFFRKSDVIAAGDVYTTVSYPVIDTAHGGTINGEIAALNHIIELTIPRDKQEGGTLVIPGRGRITDEAEVVEYRDMVTIIRDRVKAMAEKGMTLDQVKAAKPSFDYDGRYGATSGPWTTDMFITAVYEGVKPQKAQPQRRASK